MGDLGDSNQIPWAGYSEFFNLKSICNGKIQLICKLCSVTLKGEVTSTGNFKKHIKVNQLVYLRFFLILKVFLIFQIFSRICMLERTQKRISFE